MSELLDKLVELLNDTGLVLTFDRFRDSTKGSVLIAELGIEQSQKFIM